MGLLIAGTILCRIIRDARSRVTEWKGTPGAETPGAFLILGRLAIRKARTEPSPTESSGSFLEATRE
jgi:hypothetical protein